MSLIVSCLVIGHLLPAHGQSQIRGRVADRDGIPLPYVNIGIPHANTGTVSRTDGSFSLVIPDSLQQDTLWFSHIGYHTIKVPVNTLKSELPVLMSAMDIPLPEIHVFHHKPRIKKIGTTTQHPLLWGQVGKADTTDILEQAKLIKIDKPSLLLDASIYIKSPAVDSTLLRLNLYAVTEDVMPGERIYHRSLIRKFPLKKGWLKFDLDEYSILMEKPFFLSFEFLPYYISGIDYPFYIGAQFTGSSYMRHSSNGRWEKFNGASSSIYMRVKQ